MKRRASLFGAAAFVATACTRRSTETTNTTKKNANSGDLDYVVPGTVVALQQNSDCVCWAASAAIVSSWRHQQSVDPAVFAGSAGSAFAAYYRSNVALSAAQYKQFLSQISFVAEAPQNFSSRGWRGELMRNGALIVVTHADGGMPNQAHARVLTAIAGDSSDVNSVTLSGIDPGSGLRFTETLTDFLAKYEQVIKSIGSADQPLPQVVHS